MLLFEVTNLQLVFFGREIHFVFLGPRHRVAISLHVLSNVAGNYQEVLKTVDLKSGVAFLSIAWLFLQFSYVFSCIRFHHVWKAPGLFSSPFFVILGSFHGPMR